MDRASIMDEGGSPRAFSRSSGKEISKEDLEAVLQEELRTMEDPNFEYRKQTVRELFVRDIPFFTKAGMKRLKDQIEAVKAMAENGRSTDGHKFVYWSITGQEVERPVIRGFTHSRQFGEETVMLKPTLLYTTYQHLIHSKFTDSALCPLQICYGGSALPHQSSLEDTRAAFQAYRDKWEASEDCLRLRFSMISTTSLPGITKIIAFACSSISRDDDHLRHRVATQHALILTLRDILQASQPDVQIKCLAQDPAYTEIDKIILSEIGITVVDDPQGFLEVDDQSVVLSFSPNVPVRQIITDIARPVILAWDTVDDEEHVVTRWAKVFEPPKTHASAEEIESGICDPESSRVRAMIQEEYAELVKLDGNGFGDATVYIRNDGKRS